MKGKTDKKIKEYTLTEQGVDLYLIIYELQKWSIKQVEFSDNTKKYKEFTNTVFTGEFIDQILSKYREFRLEEFGI